MNKGSLLSTLAILGVHASGKTKVGESVAKKSGKECADLDIQTAQRVLQLLTINDFKNELGIDIYSIDSIIRDDIIKKIEDNTLQVSDYSKIVSGWHKQGGLFRKGESNTLRELIKEFKIVITGGGTYTIEENRGILKPTVKIMLDVSKQEQARRLGNDVEGNARRGTKGRVQPGCKLTAEERQIKEIGEFHDKWTDFIRSEVDYVFTCSEDKTKEDMRDEILATPEIQDILEYNK